MPEPPPSARREAAIVAALTLLGAVLRFWGPGRLGLDHFDEGIYAFAGLWIQSPKGPAGINPEVIAYAPPLYPMLVGVAYLLLGVSDVSAILVSQACGVLTIPAIAWVGRRTFGPGAGAAAAAFAALSGPHVAFSRMALTDSTFLLVWVLAIGFGGRFLERPGLLRAIPFGLAVGLAQNAKYNGALAGVIVALTALWGLVVPPAEGRRAVARALAYGLVAACVAALVYLPWFRFVEARPGGYAGLVAHHRGYLAGPSAWAEHWRLQMGQAVALAGPLTDGLSWGAVAWPIACLGGGFAAGGWSRASSRWDGARARLGLLAGTVVLGFAPNAPWWIALFLMGWGLTDRRIAVRLIFVGWGVMAVLTPFYHPYARLWLPLHAAGWTVLSGLIADLGPSPAAWVGGWHDRGPGSVGARARWVALASGVVLALLAATALGPRAHTLGSPLEPRDGLRDACRRLAADLTRPSVGHARRLHLVARPSAAFYLGSLVPIPILRQPDTSAVAAAFRPDDFVVSDSALGDLGSFRAYDPERFNRTAIAGLSWVYAGPTPSTTLLDLDPGAAFDSRADPTSSLVLYPLLPR